MAIGSKLLLVEDDEPSREMMTRQLVRAGFRVSTAQSAAEARSMIDTTYNLVLLDLILPDDHGWELARKWKKSLELNHIPIVALTGLVPADEAEILCTFCDAYHLKPVQFSKLLVTMNRLLATTSSIRERMLDFRLENPTAT